MTIHLTWQLGWLLISGFLANIALVCYLIAGSLEAAGRLVDNARARRHEREQHTCDLDYVRGLLDDHTPTSILQPIPPGPRRYDTPTPLALRAVTVDPDTAP